MKQTSHKHSKRATLDLWPDVGQHLGIGRNAAYEAAKKGQIPGAFKIGGRWLVSKVALERFLDGERAEVRA